MAPSVIPGHFHSVPSLPELDPASKLKKTKKKKRKGVASIPPQSTNVTSTADDLSDSLEEQSTSLPSKVNRLSPSSSQRQNTLQQSTISIDTDSSWTRIEPKRRHVNQLTGGSSQPQPSSDINASDTGITTSATGNSSPIMERTEDEDFMTMKDITADLPKVSSSPSVKRKPVGHDPL